jgi:predicted permease
MSVIHLVLPDFLLIGLGWVLLHKLDFSRTFFQNMERLVYFILFPALLFHAITQAPLSVAGAARLFQATIALMAFAVAMAWMAIPVLRPDPLDHASTVQCAFRFNTYIGLAVAVGLGGGPGQATMALLAGFAVPFVNMAAVHALARQKHGNILAEIARNPFIIATVTGLLFNLLAIPVPAAIDSALGGLGKSAIVLGLLCVGATLSLERGGSPSSGLMAWMTGVRLLATPVAALFIGQLFGLSLLDRQILLLFSALPTSSSAHVLTNRMGGNGRLTATIMSVQTLISAVTIPLWLAAWPHILTFMRHAN